MWEQDAPGGRAWSVELPYLATPSCLEYGDRMSIDARSLKTLIETELSTVSDARVVAYIRQMLIEPHMVLRDWDYGEPGQQYPCWMVLKGTEGSTGCEIAYCEFGFGPRSPWGLVSSGNDPQERAMGMDSGWFPTFLEAFFESVASIGVPIWRVFQEKPDRTLCPLTDEGTWESTWERINNLRSSDPEGRYHCLHSVAY